MNTLFLYFYQTSMDSFSDCSKVLSWSPLMNKTFKNSSFIITDINDDYVLVIQWAHISKDYFAQWIHDIGDPPKAQPSE